MTTDRLWPLLRGAVVGMALFAFAAHVAWLGSGEVSRWWLPAGLAVGVLASVGWGRRAPADDEEPAGRWLWWCTVAVLGACTAALSYGALATPARAWDGIVAWGLKAAVLTADTSLEQPFFRDPAVWHHSADYPLLQPLSIASLAQWLGAPAARLLFPALYLLFVGIGATAVARLARHRGFGCWIAIALATTPCFVNSSGGGADSGYAEMFFACALIAAAAGLLLGDGVLLAAAVFVLPLIKPEGEVVVFAVLATCFLAAQRRPWHLALAAGTVSLLLWVPLQLQLGHRAPPGFWLPVGLVGAALAAGLLRGILDWRAVGVAGRALTALAIGVAGFVALLLLQPLLATHDTALLGQYLGRLDRIVDKAAALPAILYGLVTTALSPRRFGFTFALLLVALVVLLRHRAPAESGERSTLPLLVLCGLGAGVIVGAFLLSPEPHVQHHLQSSAGRLLSHWVGVAWLAIAALWMRHRGRLRGRERTTA